MNEGNLSNYFTGIATKKLSAVEVNPKTSHQHEFNGVQQLRAMFGDEKKSLPARFIYLGEADDQTLTADGALTWYNARENHPTRTEYRLYFPSTPVMESAAEGDLLVIAMKPDNSILAVVVKQGVTYENQIRYLFGLQAMAAGPFAFQEIAAKKDKTLGFAERLILDELQIEIRETADDYLEKMLDLFGKVFPKTSVFSEYARGTLGAEASTDNPDSDLMVCMDREELLFRTLERSIVAERIKHGFGEDVDDFINFSLSVQNRRKSRVGYALENHLEFILKSNKIRYSRGQHTENKASPDFIFPGIEEYRSVQFPTARLTMLGVKSTCKDRWRQVLSEAARIQQKHLLTLEPGISGSQTDEMIANNLQLVVPAGIFSTYTAEQSKWLMPVSGFVELVKCRQVVTN